MIITYTIHINTRVYIYNHYVYTQTHAYARIIITYRIHTYTRIYMDNHYVYTQTHAYTWIIITYTHKHMRIHG